jgi:hypothetical protein
MRMMSSGWLRLSLASLALGAFAVLGAFGCSKEMDPKECMNLREQAFDLANKAQHCNTDADCRQSDWPGCAKPQSQETFDKVKAMKDSFTKGKCQEAKADCKEPPEVYCKQGLCVHREKGTPEGAGNTPVDKIIVQ